MDFLSSICFYFLFWYRCIRCLLNAGDLLKLVAKLSIGMTYFDALGELLSEINATFASVAEVTLSARSMLEPRL